MTEPLSPRDLFEHLEAGSRHANTVSSPLPSQPELRASAELVRRYFEMWNTGEGAVADQVLDPQYLDHAYPAVIGPAAARSIAPRFHRAHPDARLEHEIVGGNAEYIAVRNKIHKTHEGRLVQVERTALFRIGRGRIVEQWSWAPGEKLMKSGWPKSVSAESH